MGPEAQPPDHLRAALREIAAGDLPEVIEQARRGARARAVALIEDALVQKLMQALTPPRARPSEPSPSPEPAPEPAATKRTPGQAWWAYCVLSAEDGQAVAPMLEGLEPGTQIELVVDGELAALVSAVPLAEYDDERLREHLEDLEWVERTARAHEGVLDRVLRDATIVPLRLCTIYRDHNGVRRLLRESAATLLEGLAAVDGSIELGLKVFADPWAAPAVPEAEAGDDGPGANDRPGAAYLARRQHERTRAERVVELRARCVEAVHERLSRLAREATSNPPQRPEVHGRDAVMLLNAAYLVERGRVEEFHDAVRALLSEWQPLGFALELTGPWPAYNFISSAAGVMP